MRRNHKKLFSFPNIFPKSNRGRRKRSWLILKWFSLFSAAVFLSLAFYCSYLSIKVEDRFSGRRWSIPSKVFSDTTILYPGQAINQALLTEQLDRLGYREVLYEPSQKGKMRKTEEGLEVFFRDFQLHSRKREASLVRIRFHSDKIESMVKPGSGEQLPLLELEPQEIATLFGRERERRQLVSINQAPRNLIDAVLSAEDRRFYAHHGIDPIGVARAFVTDLTHGAVVQGGSTITQQLAKCYFLYPKRTVTRKIREILLSVVMELRYEKKEILEIYLNEIYLGQNGSVSVNGVGEASLFYFGKAVEDLSLAEAATIAGLIKAPNRYSPYVDREKCLEQRNNVLHSMLHNGWISEGEFHIASTAPLLTVGAIHYEKQAPYFIDYLKDQISSLYSSDDLSTLGLSIYTTLDPQVQMAAEAALKEGLERLERLHPELKRPEPMGRLQGAIVVMQPKTGYILAMAGGREYSISQFNRATQARRQPGSAFKPFVFLSSLDTLTPVSRLSNKPVSFKINGKTWEPKNYELVPDEYLNVRDALARSVNLAAVDLAMQVGLDHVVDTASAFQFSTPLKPVPSLALGSFEVIPLELARAYCAFAADGVLPYPLSLKEVVDEEGKALERRHMIITNVISPAKAFVMTSLLRSVVTDGTARPLQTMGIGFPVAGKTGTTSGSRDAWFVGYTPTILALVWVGFDDQTSIEATGASAALPIWADLMRSLPQYTSGEWFAMPPGVVECFVCPESGELAVAGCPQVKSEFFLEETAPRTYCSIHGNRDFIRQMWENGKALIGNL
jgi:penicillin-binding protein 1B